MKNQTAPEARATTNQSNPKLVRPESHIDRLRQLQEAIACRAYELFEGRGCEPRRLIISGSASQANEKEIENIFYRELLAKDAFRSLDLPVEVDAVNAQATLKDGILNITLPKLNVSKQSQAQASAV